MTAVKTNNLTKKYGTKTAVDNVNLEINEGELFALLGVNGAGKTTMIRMLSCLLSPTSGDAFIQGHNIGNEQKEIKQIIGISPQDTAVADNLTVCENLKFMAGICSESDKKTDSAKNNGAFGNTITERVENIIRLFGLEEVRNNRAKTLSGGWQRKLSIAMALIGNPKVLYLDEPTLGLDVLARRELWKIIGTLKESTTIILTTHYMEEAQSLADRIAVMASGRVIACGTLTQLEEKTGKKGLEEVFVSLVESENQMSREQ